MTNNASLTLRSLQAYLVELQLVIKKREDAAAAHEMSMRELSSIEAQHFREQELSKARIQAESDLQLLREKQAEAARQLQRQHEHELKIRVLEETRRAAAALEEKKRADEIKEAYEERVRASALQEMKYAKEGVRIAINSFLNDNSKTLSMFGDVVDQINRVLSSDDCDEMICLGNSIRHADVYIKTVHDVISSMESLGVSVNDIVDNVPIHSVSDFKEASENLRGYLSKLPSIGIGHWFGFDQNHRLVPPWNIEGAAYWGSKKLGLKVQCATLDSGGVFNWSELETIIRDINSQSANNVIHWRLPNLEEAAALAAIPGAFVIPHNMCVIWVSHADAPGRYSAYDLIAKKRFITGPSDRFSALIVSD